MRSLELTDLQLLVLRLKDRRGSAFTLRYAAGELDVCPQRARQILIKARWKLDVAECLGKVALIETTIGRLRYNLLRGYSLQAIATASDSELLRMRSVGAKGYKPLRELAKFLLSLQLDQQKRTLKLLGCE